MPANPAPRTPAAKPDTTTRLLKPSATGPGAQPLPAPKAETITRADATRPRQSPARGGTGRRNPPKKGTTSRKTGGPHFSVAIPQPLQREILAVLVCLFAVLTAISLGAAGSSGLVLGTWAAWLTAVFGAAAWLVPLAIAAAGIMLFVAGMLQIDRLRWEMPLGIGLILLSGVGLLELLGTKAGAAAGQAGGLLGKGVSDLVRAVAGDLGGAVILGALVIIGAIMAFHISIGDLLRLAARGGRGIVALVGGPTEDVADPPVEMAAVAAPPAGAKRKQVPAERDGVPEDFPALLGKDRAASPTTRLGGIPFEEPASPRILGADAALPPLPKPAVPDPAADGKAARPGKEDLQQLALPVPDRGGMFWALPETAMLEQIAEYEADDVDLKVRAEQIMETLASFGIPAAVHGWNKGPVVTQFNVAPGEGIRVAKIAALANDLARALAAPTIRIEAPVPGTHYVGVEVPNGTAAVVGLRNILDSPAFARNRGKLRIPIGRDTQNQPVITDLTKLPHLLIAGATGSGKSVAINSLIVSFLMQYSPAQVRMLMVDPKRVELSGFNGIPHLLRPVVTEMKSEREPSGKGPQPLTAIQVLKWLLWEMERRYKLFARGAKDAEGNSRIFRNIEQYHAAAATDPALETMPYIVLIIDELADLMLVAPEDVETALCRLAQLARATGIHLIIATQRPSVDVVTGLIKANFPARIAFAVTSMIDSRVILDTPGAEKLLGRGDALYTASDESKPIRIQGTFLSDKETEAVVKFWRKQVAEAPVPIEGATPGDRGPTTPGGLALAGRPIQVGADVPTPDWLADSEAGGNGEDDDALLQQAVELVKKHQYASTSVIQRRLRIGYNRAARLMEQMEEQGIVGPAEGSRGRAVLVAKDATSEDSTGAELPADK